MVDLVDERTGWRFDKRPLQEAKPELIDQLTDRPVLAAQQIENLPPVRLGQNLKCGGHRAYDYQSAI